MQMNLTSIFAFRTANFFPHIFCLKFKIFKKFLRNLRFPHKISTKLKKNFAFCSGSPSQLYLGVLLSGFACVILLCCLLRHSLDAGIAEVLFNLLLLLTRSSLLIHFRFFALLLSVSGDELLRLLGGNSGGEFLKLRGSNQVAETGAEKVGIAGGEGGAVLADTGLETELKKYLKNL